MKLIARFLSLTLLAGAAVLYASCDGDGGETKSEQQIQLEALSKTWTLTGAELSGDDTRFDDFTDMKLSISGAFSAGQPNGPYPYTIAGELPTPSPWPRTGTWSFGSQVKSQLIRNPSPGANAEDLEMFYTLTGNTLTIEFNCEGDGCEFAGGSGRVASNEGEWVFTFTGS
jgi:hypothetical protein